MGTYFHSYQDSALSILSAYRGQEPFAVFVRNYFKKFKKFGSRDRKAIADLCYGYLRIGLSAEKYADQEQMLIGFLVTHNTDNGYLSQLKPDWVTLVSAPLQQKLERVNSEYPSFDIESIFPCSSSLSQHIDRSAFALHHLSQPSFFLRLRPGKKHKVVTALEQAGVVFTVVDENTVCVSSQTNVENVIQVGVDCIVQDINSQRTALSLHFLPHPPNSIWDACAGSGGKSIMVQDIYSKANLFVSDIREDILDELRRRLELAQVHPAHIFCTDLENSLSNQVALSNLPSEGVELIVADVPCTGSGTWGRSPEWLRIFDPTLIGEYQKRQLSIVSNLIPHLKPGGYLLYITCSVFAAENEDVSMYLQHKFGLKQVHEQFLSGIDTGGDHLYAALFTL
jgi:16S rRNA (cytosine967-C5)-methyltransferase